MKNRTKNPDRKALGRGLDALLTRSSGKTAVEEAQAPVREIPVQAIDPNPHQPRTVFRSEAIDELAQSIRTDGLIQPILVRPKGKRFTLVAGERRLRAAKQAGLEQVPAIVRDVEEDRLLEIALVENIQREDLNPIEVALALQRLAESFQLSHEELAQRTGKDRTSVTNLLRLLRLPADIQELVAQQRITMGHARTLLALEQEDQQRQVADQVVQKGMSVRQVEQLVRTLLHPVPPKEPPAPDPNVAAAVEELERALGAPVRLVQRSPRKGKLEIEYSSPEELDRLYTLLTKQD